MSGDWKNVKEIEEYVNEITLASREDFLQLSVNPGEVYLSHVIDAIRGLYEEKLHNLHTGFQIASYNDLLLKGDEDRLIEVLQNLWKMRSILGTASVFPSIFRRKRIAGCSR